MYRLAERARVVEKEIIKIFEKLWDKYKTPLNDLLKERDEEVKKLNEFLMKLKYYGVENVK